MNTVLDMENSRLAVPLLTGTYAVAGLYLGRALSNTQSPLGFGTALMIGGTSAVAAGVSPMVTQMVICRHSPLAPILDAGVSSALTWGALRAESIDPTSAAMFIPLSIGSYLLARAVQHAMIKSAKKPQSPKVKKEAPSIPSSWSPF